MPNINKAFENAQNYKIPNGFIYFEKLFDDELVMTANSNLSSIISNYTSEGNNISILNSNISQLGFSSGERPGLDMALQYLHLAAPLLPLHHNRTVYARPLR